MQDAATCVAYYNIMIAMNMKFEDLSEDNQPAGPIQQNTAELYFIL